MAKAKRAETGAFTSRADIIRVLLTSELGRRGSTKKKKEPTQ